jgi:trk system potassium uptake protein TrkA
MRIVVVGAGDVGFHLANLLSKESHDIVVIDFDNEKLHACQTKLDVLTIKGNATSIKILKQANVPKADLLICATSSESDNITIALLGKQLGAKKTIARIQNNEFLENNKEIDFKRFGIDELVCPQDLAAEEIIKVIKNNSFSEIYEFESGKLFLIGIHINSKNKDLSKLSLGRIAANYEHLNFLPFAIKRNEDIILPKSSSHLKSGDQVYMISKPEGLDQIKEICSIQDVKLKNLMIVGGSRVGKTIAGKLAKSHDVKLIDINEDKCIQIAERIPDIMVLNADARNLEFLEQENLEGTDAFIAVTNDSETNVMLCLAAKSFGVKKVIALVENVDYIDLSDKIGIDTVINKKILAASSIFRFIRKGNVYMTSGLGVDDAEVLVLKASANSKITSNIISKVGLPEGTFVVGFVRNNIGSIITSETQLQEDDSVVVFALHEKINKIQEFF